MAVPRTDGTALPGDPNAQQSDAADPFASTALPDSEGQGSDWIKEAFAGRVGLRATPSGDFANESQAEPEKQTEEGKVAKESGATEPSGEEQKPFKVFYSQEDFDRQLQAEVDRRESVRNRRQKDDEDRRLLKESPHEYAQRKRQEMEEQEQEEQLLKSPTISKRISDFANEQIALYDELVLRPLQNLVADSPEKAKLFENVRPAIEGRGDVATGLLGLYRKQIEAEIRKSMADDPVLIKEILVKHGGQRAEPEAVSAVGAAPRREDRSQADEMNDLFRSVRRY